MFVLRDGFQLEKYQLPYEYIRILFKEKNMFSNNNSGRDDSDPGVKFYIKSRIEHRELKPKQRKSMDI